MAKVGQPLVDIRMEKQLAGQQQDATSPQETLTTRTVASTSQSTKKEDVFEQLQVATLPSVRRLAKENRIDLSKIQPTGKKGHILKDDVLAFIEEGQSSLEPDTHNQKTKSITNEKVNKEQQQQELVIPLRTIQKAMVKAMTESLNIPHFNYSDEINMTKLVEFNKKLKLENSTNSKVVVVSNLAFIIKMVSLALLEYPQLNASFDSNEMVMIQKSCHNIGVAVDTKSGLIVPNIKNVQALSIEEINSELSRLRELGYNSKLGLNDLSNGTITLSNIGAIGGIFGVPVIVPPEIVIGALGRTRKLPRFNSKGLIEECHIMQIVWSADHRVVDGATLSRFNNLLKEFLEEPTSALMKTF